MALNAADRISWDRFYAAALQIVYLEAAALPDDAINKLKKSHSVLLGTAATMADHMLEQQRKR
ncbi:hypothetical protein [Pseudomonas sp. G166]|uniref:hypothetical protein n=1 Tax=Pseudomonas sp. G166 TaxID=3094846 RepID=UPI003008426A